MNHLHERLHQAADDTGLPLTTDVAALLGRARDSRQRQRRRRAGGAVGGAAALTAAAILLVPALAGGPTSDPTPAPSDPATSTVAQQNVLSDAEIVRRCEPQLEKYFTYPMYAPERWRIVHDRNYRVGDVVQLGGGDQMSSNPVLCEIPERGQEGREVPFTRFAASADEPERLAELCAETFSSASRGEAWADLRDAEVVAADGDQDVTVALLRLGNAHYACSISSPTWDSGLSHVYATARGDVSLNGATTGSSNKSIVDQTASYYTGAGLTDPQGTKIRVTLADGTVMERPVGEDGAYAVMLRLPGEGGLLNHTIEVLGAGGQVLAEFPPM